MNFFERYARKELEDHACSLFAYTAQAIVAGGAWEVKRLTNNARPTDLVRALPEINRTFDLLEAAFTRAFPPETKTREQKQPLALHRWRLNKIGRELAHSRHRLTRDMGVALMRAIELAKPTKPKRLPTLEKEIKDLVRGFRRKPVSSETMKMLF